MVWQVDNSPRVTASVIILLVLGYTLYMLRVYTRLKAKTWGMDDWSMTVAMIPFTGLTVACLGGSFEGIGVHEKRLTAGEMSDGLHWFFFFEVFYCGAIIPIKLSISLMLMRVAAGRKAYVNSLWGITAMFTTMNLIALLYIIFQCDPVQYAWDTTIPGGHCNDAYILADIYYATTAVNIFTDWFCAILPVPLLWNVQLNRNAKMSVGFLLSLGALASLSACVRLHYTINLTNSTDYLYGVGDIVIWGYAENGVGVIVACLSTLRPLFRRLLRLGGSDSSGQTPAKNYGAPGIPSSRLHPYQEFEGGYELGSAAGGKGAGGGITTIKGGKEDEDEASFRTSGSQEHILEDLGPAGSGPGSLSGSNGGGGGVLASTGAKGARAGESNFASGIKMTRSVDVSYHV